MRPRSPRAAGSARPHPSGEARLPRARARTRAGCVGAALGVPDACAEHRALERHRVSIARQRGLGLLEGASTPRRARTPRVVRAPMESLSASWSASSRRRAATSWSAATSDAMSVRLSSHASSFPTWKSTRRRRDASKERRRHGTSIGRRQPPAQRAARVVPVVYRSTRAPPPATTSRPLPASPWTCRPVSSWRRRAQIRRRARDPDRAGQQAEEGRRRRRSPPPTRSRISRPSKRGPTWKPLPVRHTAVQSLTVAVRAWRSVAVSASWS